MAERKKCKVFLDSNVILSGLFSDMGAPRIILDLITLKLPMLTGATGRYNLLEVERNLKKKMPQALPLYHNYLPKLSLEIVALPSQEQIKKMTGATAERDVPVLVSAIACSADYLITGDKKDFDRLKGTRTHNLKIVGPAEFIEKVFPDVLKQPGLKEK